jgi:hypothetical protein
MVHGGNRRGPSFCSPRRRSGCRLTPSTAERLLPGDAKPCGERGRAKGGGAGLLWRRGRAGQRGCRSAGAWPRAVDGSRGREYDGATDEQGKEYARGGAGRAPRARALIPCGGAAAERGEQWIGLRSRFLMGWASYYIGCSNSGSPTGTRGGNRNPTLTRPVRVAEPKNPRGEK